MGSLQCTDEQKAIIASSSNLKINAVAGSGKTSTLIEYAKKRAHKKILYIAFNRSVRIEAQKRFAEAGLDKVRIETAHSLAYRHIVPPNDYKIGNYNPYAIAQLLDLKGPRGNHLWPFLVARHIGRFVTWFCNSPTLKVNDLDYREIVLDTDARTFVDLNYDRIVQGTRRFLAKMNDGSTPITHEFYLKKYQLSKPSLPYDFILFDEGQDASPVMLDIFIRQEGTKVIVGDIHQQIYAWRFAVNALGHVDFEEYSLATSFRFPQRIADIAIECLKWKHYLKQEFTTSIIGAGKTVKVKSHATLARTNLSLLRSAINFLAHGSRLKKIYFEGNFSSYTYAGEGTSIYDVLALHTGQTERIRDPLIKAMETLDNLEEYAEQSEDQELLTVIDIVEEYGKDLPKYLQMLRQCHVEDDKKHTADMIFSTIHRCKGMEYDSVSLEDGFVTEQKVIKAGQKKDLTQIDIDKLNEEINLVYVAITRTKNKLVHQESLFDKELPEVNESLAQKKQTKKYKTPTVSETLLSKRQKNPRAYEPWNKPQDRDLEHMFASGETVTSIAEHMGRNRGAIIARMKKLGLWEE